MQYVITKKNLIIATLLFFVCTSMVYAGQAVADANGTSLFSKTDSPFGKQPTPLELGDDNLGASLYRMMLSLAVVATLAIGAMYLSKKVLPKVSGITGKRVKVIETVSLGGRRTVHLLQVDSRQILIGSTQNTITRLAEISGETQDAAPAKTDDSEVQ